MADTTLRAFLLTLLRRNFDGSGWYGGSLLSALKKTDAATAAKRVGDRKTIWEQLLHAAYWKYVIVRRLTTTTPKPKFARKGSNWPAMPAVRDDAAWRADIEMLRATHAQLLAAVESLPEERLAERKVHQMVEGVAGHDVYHDGQIRLLKRLVEKKKTIRRR